MPAPKKITPVIAAQLLQRRSEGASARALQPDFGISNQAISKFFKKEDAKAAQLEHANQHADSLDRSSPDPLKTPRRPPSKPAAGGPPLDSHASQSGQRPAAETTRPRDPYHVWLDTPKNLSGRALAEAYGLVRLQNPEGTICGWREREELDALLQAGWQHA